MVKHAKYLSVKVDQHLPQDEHLSIITKNISLGIGMMKSSKLYLKLQPFQRKCTIPVETYFRSCSPVWVTVVFYQPHSQAQTVFSQSQPSTNCRQYKRRRNGRCIKVGIPDLQTLQKLQTRVTKIVINCPYDTSLLPLIKQLGCLDINWMIEFETKNIFHKSLHNELPDYLQNLFRRVSTKCFQELRNSKDLNLLQLKTRLLKMSLLFPCVL